MSKSVWKNLTDEERKALANRRYVDGVDVDTLATEIGMNSISLNRNLQRIRNMVLPQTEQKPTNRYRTYPHVDFKSAVFDIETTDFSAGGVNAHLVCICILPLGDPEEKVQTIQIEFKDKRSDKRILKDLSEQLAEYQILIGHYVLGFDLPYLQSRLAYHGMPGLPGRHLVYDTYFAARRMGLRAHRKSLAFLTDFFNQQSLKTAIYPVAWSNIDSPEEVDFLDARKNIVDHCGKDVISNRHLFDALWPLDRSMATMPVYRK